MYIITDGMERVQSAKVSCSQAIGRVTTDAVHRRFLSGKKVKPTSAEKEGDEEDDYYYCKQCNLKMTAIPGKEDLKFHFENIKHKPFATCVYCSKPVYDYRHKKKLKVYHLCIQE